MQQIYRRTSMLKCNFNKVIKQLHSNSTSLFFSTLNLLHVFRTLFLKNTSGGLLLNVAHSRNVFHNAFALKVLEIINDYSLEDFKLNQATTRNLKCSFQIFWIWNLQSKNDSLMYTLRVVLLSVLPAGYRIGATNKGFSIGW